MIKPIKFSVGVSAKLSANYQSVELSYGIEFSCENMEQFAIDDFRDDMRQQLQEEIKKGALQFLGEVLLYEKETVN